MRKATVLPAIAAIAVLLVFLAACGGNNSTQQAQMATVKVSVSDPPTCGSTQGGMYDAIYVAIQDVQIHTSASAGDNDPGWVDLTPNLKSGAPMQVNLLGIRDNQCFLAMLNQNSSGQNSGTSIQPGQYQQVRIMLASNTATVPGDKCDGVGANCVILHDGTPMGKPYPLLLSSEAQTGIKIPSGQLAGGAFVVGPGETKDLNIDFNTCASIVQQGTTFRLKPVLHLGPANLTSNSINGTLIDASTNQPITSQNVVVLLEKNDGSGTDKLYMEAKPNNLGQFDFCPVTDDGPFEVVAVAMDDTQTKAYATTVVTGVKLGNAVGKMLLYPQQVDNVVSQAPAFIQGQVATSTGTAGVKEDVTVRAQQLLKVTPGLTVIVPLALQSASGLNITAQDATTCTGVTNSFCAQYKIAVPAANPTLAAFATSNITYTQDKSATVGYTVDAIATGCSPSDKSTPTTGTLSVSAGQTASADTIQFTGCQ